uniref:Eukaryotic translation initiation factor 4B n=1 Tax=Aceria tosichella TaxID=561515 RepID=A0A6G1SD40_9ACAR
MTSQTQGKSKKKNKEVTKLSLDEFNQMDAPHGHSVVSVAKVSGLDWAATMADHDLSAVETQQIVVPTATRAQRGPNVDFDSLPDAPPFRASLYNLVMSADEKDVSDRFFTGLDVKRVEITKAMTTVEFETKEGLYEALCKDGTTFKGKTVSVCLYGQQPQNSYQDRFGGGRGGNSPYNDRYNDRYGDRGGQSGGFGGFRSNDRYGDRPGGGFNDRPVGGGFNDRQGYNDRPGGGFSDRGRDGGGGFDRPREGGFAGYNRSGSAGFRGQPRGGGGYGQRFQDGGNPRDNPRGLYTSGGGEPEPEEPKDWRARPTINRPAHPPQHHIPERPPQHQHHAPSSPPSEARNEDRPSYKGIGKVLINQILKTE